MLVFGQSLSGAIIPIYKYYSNETLTNGKALFEKALIRKKGTQYVQPKITES